MNIYLSDESFYLFIIFLILGNSNKKKKIDDN